MNRRLLAAGALTIALSWTPSALAAPAPALSRQAEAVIQRLAPPESHVGVSVVDVASGETLYEREGQKLYAPASLTKLATSAAALTYMGAQRQFQTRILVDGATTGGIVRGHLYLKGEGDPTLRAADLDALAAALKAQGIRTVTGDVVADATLFQLESPAAPGWSWDDLDEDYGVPPSALTLSGNVGLIGAVPGARPGDPVRLTQRPVGNYIELRSQVTTGATGSVPRLELTGEPGGWKEVWTLTGTLPAGGPGVELARAVADPARFAGVTMKEALARQGIVVHGTLRLGATPASARTVAAHASAPLAELVRAMNKESDNLIAETLLIHLGVRGQGGPGTRDKGLRTMKAFLDRAGWTEGGYRLEDGSGLSTYDAMTPCQLTALLRTMPTVPLAYPAYLISLPVSGVDGTLASRMADPAVRGRLRAKTGTMSGVSGLAGYLTTDAGRTVAVAIMVNGFVGPAARARQMQDELVKAIAAADAERAQP